MEKKQGKEGAERIDGAGWGWGGSGEGGSNDIKMRREKAQKENNETERFCSLLLRGKQSSNKTRLAINVGICIHWSVKRQAKCL